MPGHNSKKGSTMMSKKKWTKIAKMALGIKCKGDPFSYSSSTVALEKSKITNKACWLRGSRRKGFSAIDIIWLATHSGQILQKLTFTGPCVKSAVGGKGTHAVPKPINILLYQEIITITYAETDKI